MALVPSVPTDVAVSIMVPPLPTAPTRVTLPATTAVSPVPTDVAVSIMVPPLPTAPTRVTLPAATAVSPVPITISTAQSTEFLFTINWWLHMACPIHKCRLFASACCRMRWLISKQQVVLANSRPLAGRVNCGAKGRFDQMKTVKRLEGYFCGLNQGREAS